MKDEIPPPRRRAQTNRKVPHWSGAGTNVTEVMPYLGKPRTGRSSDVSISQDLKRTLRIYNEHWKTKSFRFLRASLLEANDRRSLKRVGCMLALRQVQTSLVRVVWPRVFGVKMIVASQ